MRKSQISARKEGMGVEKRENRRKGGNNIFKKQVRKREKGKKVRNTRQKTEEN